MTTHRFSGDYPANWGEIAQQVKADAGNRCIRCGHHHDRESGHVLTVHHLNGRKSPVKSTIFGIINGEAQVLPTPTPPLTTRPVHARRGLMNHSTKPQSKYHALRGREICRELYPELGDCERCGDPAVDRHHKDGDTFNNVRDNIEFLCRRCHMAVDGRLAVFESTSMSNRGEQPPKECLNCGRLQKPLRRGRCHACNEYLRRRGVERPYRDDGRRERFD